MQNRKNRLLNISAPGFRKLRWGLSALSTSMAAMMVMVLESNY